MKIMNSKQNLLLSAIALLAALMAAPAFAAETPSGKKKSSAAESGEDLFAKPKVLRFKIDLPDSAQESLRKEPKRYVKATLHEAGRTYTDIGVRLKGSGSFSNISDKPSLSIKFDEFVKDQELRGRGRILLNDSHKDPIYLCEALGGEVFREAGVPAAKITFARVEMNGREPHALACRLKQLRDSYHSKSRKRTPLMKSRNKLKISKSPKSRATPRQPSSKGPDDFVSVARRLECDEDKGRFEKKLGKIAKAAPASKPRSA